MRNAYIPQRCLQQMTVALLAVAALFAGSERPAAAQDFRNIYIPIDDLDVLFNSQKGVLLSRQDFVELWNLAHPGGKAPQAASQDLLIVREQFSGSVESNALRLKGDVEIEKRSAGWQTLPLGLAGVSIASAVLDDQPAPIGLDETGTPVVFVRDAGRRKLHLELLTPLAAGRDAQVAKFKLPSAPGELVLTVAAGSAIRVGATSINAVEQGGERRFPIPLGGRAEFTVAIIPAAAQQSKAPLVVAHVNSTIKLTPSQAEWRDHFEVDVFAQPIDSIRLFAPVGQQVVGVESQGLARWESAEADGGTLVTLFFSNPVSGRRAIDVHAIGPVTLDKPWQVPRLVVREAAVQTGSVHLNYDPSLLVELKSLAGAQRVSPPKVDQNSVEVAARVGDYRLEALVRQKARRLATSIVTLIDAGRNRLTLRSSITVEPRGGSLFELPLTLSPGWSVASVQIGDKTVPYQSSEGNGPVRILVPLETPVPADQALSATVNAERTPENWLSQAGAAASVDVATVAVDGAAEVEGMILLSSSDEIRVGASNLTGLESVPVAGVPGAAADVRLALRYRNGTNLAGKIDATLLPPQVLVEADAAVHLTASQLAAHYSVRYQIKGGTTNVLSFVVPGVSENQVQVSLGRGGMSLVSQTTTIDPGGLRWDLKFDRQLSGFVIVVVRIERPRPENEQVAFPVLSVPGALRQSGTIAIEGEADQRVEIAADQALRSIDPTELPGLPGYRPLGRLVGSFRYRQLPYSLNLGITRHPKVDVLSAFCKQASIVSVVDASGLARHQATYVIANGGEQRLRIALAEGEVLLSAVLDGEPVEVRRVGDEYLVAIPLTTSGRDETSVVLTYHGKLEPLGLRGEVRQSPPKLNLNVVDLDWKVYLPNEKIVVASDGTITPTRPLSRSSIIGGLRNALIIPGGKRIFNPLEILTIPLGSRASETFSNVGTQIGGAGGFGGGGMPETAAKSAAPSSTSGLGMFLTPSATPPPNAEAPPMPAPTNRPLDEAAPNMMADSGYALKKGEVTRFRAELKSEATKSEPRAPKAAVESKAEGWAKMPLADDVKDQSGKMDGLSQLDDKSKEVAKSDAPLSDERQAGARAGRRGQMMAGAAGAGQMMEEQKARAGMMAKMGADPAGASPQSRGGMGVDAETFGTGQAPEPNAAMFGAQMPKRAAAEIRDGVTNTILAGEAAQAELNRQARLRPKGLLSVAIAMEPVGRPIDFKALRGDGSIVLSLQDDRFAATMTGVIMLAVVMLAWLLRDSSRRLRALFIAFGFAISLGFSGLAPLDTLYILDGLFLGAVVAWLLYIVRAIVKSTKPKSAAVAAATLVLLFASHSVTQAQEATEKVPALAPRPNELPTVFVPYDPGKDPLSSTQVYLPKEEYDRLWNQAHPDRVILADPKAAGVVTEARYAGVIEEKSARFTATFVVHSFRDRWIAVRIPVADSVVTALTLDGAPASLVAAAGLPQTVRQSTAMVVDLETGPGEPEQAIVAAAEKAEGKQVAPPPAADLKFPAVFLRGRGPHKVEFAFERPVNRVGSTGDIALELGTIGAASLNLTLPEDQLEVAADGIPGGWVLTGKTLAAAVSAGGKVSIRWQPKDARRSADLLASAQQSTRVEVESVGLRLLSRIEYQIQQGSASRFEVLLPEPLRIRSVTGEAVADWMLEGAGMERKLVVRTGRPVSGPTRLGLDLFLPQSPAAPGNQPAAAADGNLNLALPALVPNGASREVGSILVTADPTLEVRLEPANLQRIDKGSFAGYQAAKERAAWPILGAYRYAARPFTLGINASPRQGRLVADVVSQIIVEKERVRLGATVNLSKTAVPLVTATVRLPKGFLIDSVAAPPNVRWQQIEDPSAVVLEFEQAGLPVVLAEPASQLAVKIDGWIARDPNAATLDAPNVVVQGAARQTGYWSIFAAPGFDVQTESATALLPAEPSRVPQEVQVCVIASQTKAARIIYSQQDASAKLSLRVSSLLPRVRADVVTIVSVRDVAVAYVSKVRFTIEQAGVRRFAVAVPEWMGGDVDISGNGVRQVETSPPADGKRRYRVDLDHEVVGAFDMLLVQVLPLSEDGLIKTPRIAPEAVESSTTHILLENLSVDQLDPVATPDLKTETVKVDQLPVEVAIALRSTVIEVLRLQSPDREPSWRLRAAERTEALTASVNLVDVTMVVDADATYTAQANYRVANRQEQFLTLQFPEGVQIWSVFVAGRPSHPSTSQRNGQEVVLIPLPKTAAGDFSSLVEVVYKGRLDVSGSWWRRWAFPSPAVIDLPVAETQWTLFLPRTFNYSLFEGTLEESEQAYVELNRKAATFREAFGLLSISSSGKGAARDNAMGNLKNLDLGVNYSQAPINEKTRQLLDQIQRDQSELGRQIQNLDQQVEMTTTAANRVQLNHYFLPLQAPPAQARPQPADKPATKAGKDDGAEAVRSKLQRQLGAQSLMLNEQQRAYKEAEQLATPAPQPAEPARQQTERGRFDEGRAGKQDGQQAFFDADLGDFESTVTRAGGLSLRIDLPTSGERLHFVKSRGDATLSMRVAPAELANIGAASIWMIVTVCASLSLGLFAGRPGAVEAVASHWRTVLLVLGLVWWLTLPASGLGFLLALVGGFCLILNAAARRINAENAAAQA